MFELPIGFLVIVAIINIVVAIFVWAAIVVSVQNSEASRREAQKRYRSIREIIALIDEPNRAACLRALDTEEVRFRQAPGSSHNHQAWRGGYLDHVVEACNMGIRLYETMSAVRPLPFSLSDLLLCIFLHDFEKPWKYVLGQDELQDADLSTKEKRHAFRESLIRRYGFVLTDEHRNGIEYAEGELTNYSNRHRYMGRLAAFVHCCDVLSARAFHDHPLEADDPWGATRHAQEE